LLCYAWGTKNTIYYCGSVTRDYQGGDYNSNLHGRVHNYFQNHRKNPSGRMNTNLWVFENICKIIHIEDVYLFVLKFDLLKIGNEQVDYKQYTIDPDLVLAVEQLLIASYKRKSQCAWNRTPSSKPTDAISN